MWGESAPPPISAAQSIGDDPGRGNLGGFREPAPFATAGVPCGHIGSVVFPGLFGLCE